MFAYIFLSFILLHSHTFTRHDGFICLINFNIFISRICIFNLEQYSIEQRKKIKFMHWAEFNLFLFVRLYPSFLVSFFAKCQKREVSSKIVFAMNENTYGYFEKFINKQKVYLPPNQYRGGDVTKKDKVLNISFKNSTKNRLVFNNSRMINTHVSKKKDESKWRLSHQDYRSQRERWLQVAGEISTHKINKLNPKRETLSLS